MVWIPQITDLADRLGAADLAAALRDPSEATVRVALDDPGAGRISGVAVLAAWLAEQEKWRAERRVDIEPVATTVTEKRAVGEWVVHLNGPDGRRIGLPVAVAVEPASTLPVRIYHSRWPLLGHHVVRPPLLPHDPDAHASDVVGAYKAALGAGDTDGVVATFAADGYFREPSGDAYRYVGTHVLSDFYKGFFSAGGGIPLKLCTVTEDGTRSAFEYICDRWGDTDLPPQAGLAVYTRGADGLIAAAHVYDDVEGPVE
ncbi:nuclear transport factor 2 family protein [Streptomyces sp. NPDC001530]|uniref:nuclear transport factor 2 family protein n=1 Tax=Streptomyces sp. NPDC001530 TaxID=3364582 RepID=UPI0036D0588F